MPPKAKFTKEQIVKTAFDMTRENGFSSVTARELGKRLGTSASPIFTVFQSMSELQQEVRKLAMQEFITYVGNVLDYTPSFKRFGMQMISFAMEEPQLFRILYMEENEENRSFDDLFKTLGEPAYLCVDIIQKENDVTKEEAIILFKQAWIHAFSIGVLLVNKICCFTKEEIAEMLSLEFQGVLYLLKSGNYRQIEVIKK